MGRRCVVPKCKSGYDSCPEKVSMFSVPKNRIEEWQKAIARNDRLLTCRDAVCEKHFRKKDVIRVVKTEIYTYPLERPKLSETAIPSIFPTQLKYGFRPRVPKLSLGLIENKRKGDTIISRKADEAMKINSKPIKFMSTLTLTTKQKLQFPDRSTFLQELNKSRNKSHNVNALTKEKYDELITKISKLEKTPVLRKYDIIIIDGVKKLMSSYRRGQEIKLYVHDDELFGILLSAHVSLKHAGQHIMMAELEKTYKNICFKDVILFISLCPRCVKKKIQKVKVAKKDKHKTTQLQYYNELSSKCQLNIIDYQSTPDGEFKFILIYTNLLTRYYVLKPLKSRTSDEIFTCVSEIFAFIGVPLIIYSEINANLIEDIMKKIRILWPKTPTTYIKCEDSQKSINLVNEHLENWMEHNNSNNWSNSLHFIQLIMNQDYNDEIQKTPYEALFGLPTNDADDEHTNTFNGNFIKEENVEIISYICEICGNETGSEQVCLICVNNY